MTQPSQEDLALWKKYIDAAKAMYNARRDLFQNSAALVELFRSGLHEPTTRPYTLELVGFLKDDDRKELFANVLALASFCSGATKRARDLILGLPREWVLANIEETAEPLLRDGTYEEYRCILDLYSELDQSLTYKLAQRAVAHTDPDIIEAGQDFLEKLGVEKN